VAVIIQDELETLNIPLRIEKSFCITLSAVIVTQEPMNIMLLKKLKRLGENAVDFLLDK